MVEFKAISPGHVLLGRQEMAKAVCFTNLVGWGCEGTLWIDLPKAFTWGGGLKACVDQNDPSLLEVRGG